MALPPPKSLVAFLTTPLPQYVPVSAVNFGYPNTVQPFPLPATSMVFPNAWDNKMLNIPHQNVFAINAMQRTGRMGI